MKLRKEVLLQLYPDYNTVLGPYERKDGRKHVDLNNSKAPNGDKNKTKTISYPKAIIESNINRRLTPNETVDHIDRNKSNNKKNNLQILERSTHCKLDALRIAVDEVICPECGSSFKPTRHQVYSDLNKAGPFCSRICSGKYGSKIRNGGNKIGRSAIRKKYYKLEKV
jgi:hypothetical protein